MNITVMRRVFYIMKKFVRFLVFVAIQMCVSTAFAEGNVLRVELGIFDYGTIVIPSEAKFELYSPTGEKVSESAVRVEGDDTKLTLDFVIPEYEENVVYNLVATEGVTELKYVGTSFAIGQSVPLNTADGMNFMMEAIPLYKPKTGARTDKVAVRLHMKNGNAFPTHTRFFLFNMKGELLKARTADIPIGASMVPIEFPIGEYYTGEEFYLVPADGVIDATYYADTYNKYAPIKLGTYAELSETGETVVGDSFDIGITTDTKGVENEYATEVENYINRTGIGSKTNYFIWVSKKDYKLNVFTRNNGMWDYVTSFDCTIGNPSTPTITGEFEYFQYQDIWKYDKYYVAPIMRFAPKGYALHSTLIKYNGEPYDARLRGKLSHGCVRLAPESIKWLADSMPIGTRVYITE